MKLSKMLRTQRSPAARSGFTLLETMIALTLFAILGYGLAIAVKVGNNSQATVISVSAEDRSLRGSSTALVDELECSSDSQITVTTLADGNNQVQFLQPIEVGGALDWGVFDRTLGPDAASQNRSAWSIRYTVRDQPAGNGSIVKQLVRQTLDNAGVVQREKVMVEGLRSGAPAPAGFKMIKQGLVWELTLSTIDAFQGKPGLREVFHVHARN
jgi:prepilin-type N-terminal cleavage/methylation domain-containing protein